MSQPSTKDDSARSAIATATPSSTSIPTIDSTANPMTMTTATTGRDTDRDAVSSPKRTAPSLNRTNSIHQNEEMFSPTSAAALALSTLHHFGAATVDRGNKTERPKDLKGTRLFNNKEVLERNYNESENENEPENVQQPLSSTTSPGNAKSKSKSTLETNDPWKEGPTSTRTQTQTPTPGSIRPTVVGTGGLPHHGHSNPIPHSTMFPTTDSTSAVPTIPAYYYPPPPPGFHYAPNPSNWQQQQQPPPPPPPGSLTYQYHPPTHPAGSTLVRPTSSPVSGTSPDGNSYHNVAPPHYFVLPTNSQRTPVGPTHTYLAPMEHPHHSVPGAPSTSHPSHQSHHHQPVSSQQLPQVTQEEEASIDCYKPTTHARLQSQTTLVTPTPKKAKLEKKSSVGSTSSSGTATKNPQGPGYSRKKKSLGVLAENFLNMYKDSPRGATVIVDEAAAKLSVERRRIYDVVNILEAIQLVCKKHKNTYSWMGLDYLDEVFGRLQSEAIEDYPEDAEKYLGVASPTIQTESPSIRRPKKSQTRGREFKSLARLSQEFLQVFLVGPATLSLPEASDRIQGQTSVEDLVVMGQGTSSHMDEKAKKIAAARGLKTKIRRLYDIANVFLSVGLLEKVDSHDMNRRPNFRWSYRSSPKEIYEFRNAQPCTSKTGGTMDTINTAATPVSTRCLNDEKNTITPSTSTSPSPTQAET